MFRLKRFFIDNEIYLHILCEEQQFNYGIQTMFCLRIRRGTGNHRGRQSLPQMQGFVSRTKYGTGESHRKQACGVLYRKNLISSPKSWLGVITNLIDISYAPMRGFFYSNFLAIINGWKKAREHCFQG